MGIRQAMVLIGNATQATNEGKSGPVETGLTGPAATALSTSWLQYYAPKLSTFYGNVEKW